MTRTYPQPRLLVMVVLWAILVSRHLASTDRALAAVAHRGICPRGPIARGPADDGRYAAWTCL